MKNLILLFVLFAAFIANANSDINTNQVNYIFNDRSNCLAIAFSPDSKFIAAGKTDGSIVVLDITTSKFIKTFEGHNQAINAIVFTKDGKQIISASEDKLIKIWDIKSGECVKKLSGHVSGITSLSIEPKGRRLVSATGYADGEIKLWDIRTGKCIETINHSPGAGAKNVVFSPEGKRIAAGGYNHKIVIYSTATRDSLFSIDTGARISSLAFTPDGKYITVISSLGQILNWPLEDTKRGSSPENIVSRGILPTENSNIAFNPVNKDLAYSSENTIEILGTNYRSLELEYSYPSSRVSFNYLAYSPNGKMLASTCSDGTIRIWDMLCDSCKSKPHTFFPPIPFDIIENSLTFTDSDSNNIIEPGDRCQIHFRAVNYLPQDVYKLVKKATVTGNIKGIKLEGQDTYAVNIKKGETRSFVFSFTVKDDAPIETGFVEITLYLEGWGGDTYKKYTTEGQTIRIPTRAKE